MRYYMRITSFSHNLQNLPRIQIGEGQNLTQLGDVSIQHFCQIDHRFHLAGI